MLLPEDMGAGMGHAHAEALAQRQRVFQTGVFICLMLLMMDTRDPRLATEAAVARARADADAAADRRAHAPAWLNEAVPARKPQNVSGLFRGTWAYGAPSGNGTSLPRASRAAPADDGGRAIIQLELFRVEAVESLSIVRALVSLAAPPGGSRRDILASAFGVYFHESRTAALLGNLGEPTEGGVDLRRRNDTVAPAAAAAAAAALFARRRMGADIADVLAEQTTDENNPYEGGKSGTRPAY